MSNTTTPYLSNAYLIARDAADAAADEERKAREACEDEADLDSEITKAAIKAKIDMHAKQERFEKHVDLLPQNRK